jgi:hypothetical protein
MRAFLATIFTWWTFPCIRYHAFIQGRLVYGKHTGNLIGYTDLGKVNNHLLAFERSVNSDVKPPPEPAETMLVFMVKGIFTQLKYPYAQFCSIKLTGDCFFQLFWEAVNRLERLGLGVSACSTSKYVQWVFTIIIHLHKGYSSYLGWSLQ